MGGGGNVKQATAQENAIIADQRGQAQQLQQQSQDFISKGQSEEDPLVKFLQGIIGGNSTDTNQAMAPILANIAHGSQASKENILNSTPPGAARDYALAGVERDKGAQVAGATNQTFLSAFPQLASIGGQDINTGGALTGASISSRANAGTGAANVASQQITQQGNKMNAITGLASTAGSIFTGLPLGKAGGGGSQAPTTTAESSQWAPNPSFNPNPAYNFSPGSYAAPGYMGASLPSYNFPGGGK